MAKKNKQKPPQDSKTKQEEEKKQQHNEEEKEREKLRRIRARPSINPSSSQERRRQSFSNSTCRNPSHSRKFKKSLLNYQAVTVGFRLEVTACSGWVHSRPVYKDAVSLIELCRVQLKIVQLTSGMPASDVVGLIIDRAALAGLPEIPVTTPKCIRDCFSAGSLQPTSISESLEILVLDEADLLLQFGFGDDLKALTPVIPRRCQSLLMSATSSTDVDQLKKLILHNPLLLTLSKVEDVKDGVISKNVQQFWISCSTSDKLLYVLALLKLELVLKKVLIFTNTIDTGFRLKLFFEKVINFDMPSNASGYVHCIGRTGRAYGAECFCLSCAFVSPEEMEIFEEIKSFLGDEEDDDTNIIMPFSILTKDAMKSLRYRAEDVARSVTRVAVRESRAQDLRNEILNSEK
ncbi:hypothetical protein REPUB_Repub09cG0148000 [Reevesia pubescens]